jgi:beta-galactosidase/beta-glucuronidase
MSIISGKANWLSENDKPTKKEQIKKEAEFTEAKKLKVVESLLKKLSVLESEVVETYKVWPTSELSSVISLINSARFNIKKIKPVKE